MIHEYNNNNIEFINESLKKINNNINLNNIISNPFLKIYVYELGKQKYGFIAFSKYYERLEIDYIFVKEEYRKMGIGSKLLEFIINENSDIENITLEVKINNEAAIKLYKKMNFEIVATREKYYEDGLSAYLMERKF